MNRPLVSPSARRSSFQIDRIDACSAASRFIHRIILKPKDTNFALVNSVKSYLEAILYGAKLLIRYSRDPGVYGKILIKNAGVSPSIDVNDEEDEPEQH